jgi:hypothetical protein
MPFRYILVQVFTHTHTHTQTHLYNVPCCQLPVIYIYICVCVCMGLYVSVCVCEWGCIPFRYILVQVYTHTHTHTHTNTDVGDFLSPVKRCSSSKPWEIFVIIHYNSNGASSLSVMPQKMNVNTTIFGLVYYLLGRRVLLATTSA